MKIRPTTAFDQAYEQPLLGVDEVGTGAIAGPIYAAGVVILSPDLSDSLIKAGLNDSKQLSPSKRDRIGRMICEQPASRLWFTIASVGPDQINRLGHSNALTYAIQLVIAEYMKRFVGGTVLMDGNVEHSKIASSVVKGDMKSPSIAAASIIAKVDRDAEMCALDQMYPRYGFRENKGYVTPEHKALLQKHGPCLAHRVYTEPVRAWIEEHASAPTQTPEPPVVTVRGRAGPDSKLGKPLG